MVDTLTAFHAFSMQDENGVRATIRLYRRLEGTATITQLYNAHSALAYLLAPLTLASSQKSVVTIQCGPMYPLSSNDHAGSDVEKVGSLRFQITPNSENRTYTFYIPAPNLALWPRGVLDIAQSDVAALDEYMETYHTEGRMVNEFDNTLYYLLSGAVGMHRKLRG